MKHHSTWFAGCGALTIAAILVLVADVSRGNQKLKLSQPALSNASSADVASGSVSKLEPATGLRSAQPVSAPEIPVIIKAPTLAGLPPASGLNSPARPTAVVQPSVQSYGKLPLSFEANQGQTDARAQFLSRGRGYSLFLTGNAAVLALKKPSVVSGQPSVVGSRQSSAVRGQLPGITKPGQRTTDHGSRTTDSILRMKLVGANASAAVTGADELPGKSNYFIGNDPKKWRTNISTYAKVQFQNVYSGVDLVYYGNQDGQLEFEFVVAPGADPQAIRLDVGAALVPARRGRPQGAPLRIAGNGELIVRTGDGEVRFDKPVAYQTAAPGQGQRTTDHGQRTPVESHYVLTASNHVRFALSPYDHAKPLFIDPILTYSTYLGGSDSEFGYAIAVDGSGNVYVTGDTGSTDFPTLNPEQVSLHGTTDAFVRKLSSDGSALMYSTYLGGSSNDGGSGIAVDSTGNAHVAGWTFSTDFPTVDPFQASNHGKEITFVTTLSADGAHLVYSRAWSNDTIPLAGEWRFEIAGANAEEFLRELPEKIHLPGTMDDAGLGPKNTKPPTLEGPHRLYDYAGPAWYQRDVEIPAGWQGKRVTLFLERCRWVTTVWLDDKRIGSQDSLIAPHVYDFGTGVAPGKHRLTICVDNTVKIDLGRFVSALFGGTWGNMNGIVGRIELAATPPVWIDDVQVYPNVDKKLARVAVKIGNATGKAGLGKLRVGTQMVEAAWDEKGGHADVDVDMSSAKLWDEFAPNLSEVSVKLGEDERTVRFGMRKFAVRGTQFTLNDRPVFLRGTLECSVFPLTGYPPTDVAAWQRVYRIMKSYGLNFIRFHSWSPPEAAFAAADIEGIMVQAEGPMANVDAGENSQRDAFIAEEFKRIVDTYGNHPSFSTMTLGNEYGGKAELLTHWVDMLVQRDPRHLYSSASWAQTTPNRQFTEHGDGRGIRGPDTERDLHDVVARDGRPVIGHEIGQWMYFPDFKEIKKWTGVMALKNFEMIREDMEKKHLLDLAPEYVEASGKFATLLYKEEIEVLLRTPGYAGFSLLDLHDYPTQGTALVGPLDPFWDSKGFITPAAYRRFCSSTVPLLRMPRRTYTSDETFVATADLAHYGAADLPNEEPVWTIKDEQGREVAAGKLPMLNVPTGKLTELGTIKASLASARAPGKLTVTVSLPGTQFVNDWEIWVYPAKVAPQPPTDIVVCERWDEAKAALAEGKKVVFFPLSISSAQSMGGKFLPVFWSPVWFPSQKPNTMGLLCDPRHPLFAQFPTELHSNWQWFDLMEHSRLFNLDSTPADYRPLVQVIDNFARNQKLGVMFEGRVGDGRLLVSGFDLPHLTSAPAARQLLLSLYTYVSSAKFKPTQELGTGLLEKLFAPKSPNQLQALGPKISADSQAPENGAALAIDNDPDTLWHTPWEGSAPKFPHELVIELAKPAKLAGITCLPRQDDNANGRIKEYAVFTSADGKNWGTPVAQGEFQRSAELQTVKFAKPVEARYLKFVANSAFDSSKPYASLAELDIIPGE